MPTVSHHISPCLTTSHRTPSHPTISHHVHNIPLHPITSHHIHHIHHGSLQPTVSHHIPLHPTTSLRIPPHLTMPHHVYHFLPCPPHSTASHNVHHVHNIPAHPVMLYVVLYDSMSTMSSTCTTTHNIPPCPSCSTTSYHSPLYHTTSHSIHHIPAYSMASTMSTTFITSHHIHHDPQYNESVIQWNFTSYLFPLAQHGNTAHRTPLGTTHCFQYFERGKADLS